MRLRVERGDITTMPVTAIVNPANAQMRMGGGVAGTIKQAGGASIEQAAQEQAPVPVGEAIVTHAGDLPADHVIHAPTMEQPTADIPLSNVRAAMRAIIETAVEHGLVEVAVPGLGTGVGNVAPEEAATAMVAVCREHGDADLTVILIAYDDTLEAAFLDALDH